MAKILLSEVEQRYLADSEYLQKDVKRLTAERDKLVREISSVNAMLSDLKSEQMTIEKANIVLIEKAKNEASGIIKGAKGIEETANMKRSGIETKLASLADQKKELDNLVKSNEGLSKNLAVEKRDVESLKNKLISIVNIIKKEIGG